MYSLFINDTKMVSVSQFREYLEPLDLGSNVIKTIFESKVCRDNLLENFDIEIFSPYLIPNSVKSVKLVEEESNNIVYLSNKYSALFSVRWVLDEEDNKPKLLVVFIK